MSIENLKSELALGRKQVVTDGYEMSFGELASMYKHGELVINPVYQRLYRWSDSQRTRFVESLLLGIPIPPIFVYQDEQGVWELIDGLQRVSTLFQLMGLLTTPDGGGPYPQLELSGTNLLPSLAGMTWAPKYVDDPAVFDSVLQLELRRSRIRVEILKNESDVTAKFELFQRLNTGGSKLSEQEVRNSVIVMLNPEFYGWLIHLTAHPSFRSTVSLTPTQESQQQGLEIVLRFIAYRRRPYESGLDVNEYLDVAARELSSSVSFDRAEEQSIFEWVFDLLDNVMGSNAFKRWSENRHLGPFTISAFDAIAYGVAINQQSIEQRVDKEEWLQEKIRGMWQQGAFLQHSGSGVRGTTRLVNLLPWARHYFSQ